MLDKSLLVNLDCFSIDPQDVRDHARKLMDTDVSPEDKRTRNQLAAYACLKAEAMECRLSGSVVKALEHENHCDRIYGSLPEYAQW